MSQRDTAWLSHYGTVRLQVLLEDRVGRLLLGSGMSDCDRAQKLAEGDEEAFRPEWVRAFAK